MGIIMKRVVVFILFLIFLSPVVANAWSRLEKQVIFGALPEVEKALALGVNINAVEQDGDGETLFMYALKRGRPLSVIQKMVENGADLGAVDRENKTVLMYAAAGNSAEVILYLLEKGVPVDSVDKTGRNALMEACVENSSSEVVSVLIKAGCPVNGIDKKKKTALMFAARETINPEVIEILLLEGADIKMEDERGFSAYHYFQKNKVLKESSLAQKLYF